MTEADVGAEGHRQRNISRSSWICIGAIVLGTLISLALRAVIPLNPMGFADGFFDDGLFERSAVSLSTNAWLGPFDLVTLSKGPGFPALVWAVHLIGMTPPVGAQVTYLLGAGCLAVSFWIVTRRPVPATIVYVILALDPVNFNYETARVVRDNWYSGLSLLFLSSFFLTILLSVRRKSLLLVLPAAVLSGLSGAAFWLCREEGAWIIPSALLIVIALPLISFVQRLRRGDQELPTAREIAGPASRLIAALAVVSLVFITPIALVGVKNERVYGVGLTNDFASGAFADAYAAWSRVRGVPLKDFVPINRAQREAVYAISPAARELQPLLEDPKNGWIQFGCSSVGVCDDFAGGWEPWAIREATASTGHFSDEPDFQTFFAKIADDIEKACDKGELQCSAALSPSLQPLQRASIPATVRSALYWLAQLPVNETYYTFLDRTQMFTVSDLDRATMQQGISGVPDTDQDALTAVDRYEGSYRWIHVWLGYLFLPFFLVLVGMAGLGLILGVSWRQDRPRRPALWVLTASLALGIVTRLVLFAVLDSTQFTIVARYHYPTRTFMLALAAIGAVHLVNVVREHAHLRFGGGPGATLRDRAAFRAGGSGSSSASSGQL